MRNPLFIFILISILIFISPSPSLLAQQPKYAPGNVPPGRPSAKSDTNKKRILIRHADILRGTMKDTVSLQVAIGNVVIQHDSTFIYCDSLYLYDRENKIQAFSRVKVEMADSVTLRSDRMDYDGNTRIADVFDNITLTDGNARLETDILSYYRDESFGDFREGGVLYSGEDTLTSEFGYFYPNDDMAYFKENVVLKNPERLLLTDTLGYDTKNKVAIFITETKIISSDGELTTTSGQYDTQNRKVDLFGRNKITNKDYDVESDSLYFDNDKNIGYARGNLVVNQKDSSMTVMGNYGKFDRDSDESYVTRNAVAIQYFDDDTLYIAADTLFTLKSLDTIRIAQYPDTFRVDSMVTYRDSIIEKRIFRAYHNVQIFMGQMQGKCDSLVYFYSDSTLHMYADPVIWSEKNQISGDTILLYMKNSKIDSMSIVKNGFMVSEEDTVGFNQIKGKNMQAKFIDNQIHYLHVVGNSETIYFAKDDKTEDYQGVSQSSSQQMLIYFKDNEVQKIKNIKEMQAELTPYFMVMFENPKLEGMQWRISERPIRPTSPQEFAERKKIQ